MASKKDEMAQRLKDTYAQDPTTRLRALEQTEPIQDATAPLAINAMMMHPAIPAAASILSSRLAGLYNGGKQMYDAYQNNGSAGDYLRGGVRAASPFLPLLHNQILKFLEPYLNKESNLPYRNMGGL